MTFQPAPEPEPAPAIRRESEPELDEFPEASAVPPPRVVPPSSLPVPPPRSTPAPITGHASTSVPARSEVLPARSEVPPPTRVPPRSEVPPPGHTPPPARLPPSPARDSLGTVDDLHESAVRRTGLTDFGADAYVDGLAVLLDSYVAEADLTPLGRKMSRAFLRDALVARLLSEAAWQRYPQHADADITRPIFVVGLPRTGTTALHRLLTADPAHQGLEMWLTQAPQPRPPRHAWAADPVFAQIQAAFARRHVEHPEFLGVRYIAADQVEECWQLLRQSMRSVSHECLAHLPTYSAWLAGQDWTGAYRRHRRNLQLIGLPDTDRRWVLKDPSHLFALDALLAVYPDALVIQAHRGPRVAIASACSLAAHATAGWSDTFRGDVIGADQLEFWARGLDLLLEARSRADPARFCDVEYDDFVADPIGTIESVYARFGLELTGRAADTMRELASRADARPAHAYALADFGLTGEQVDERFTGYARWRYARSRAASR